MNQVINKSAEPIKGPLFRRRVLFISYHFPPVGGSGVQRNLKYIKYLPQFGWEPFVLTVKDINYLIYDYSLMREIPSEAHILQTESLDPQRLAAFLFGQRQARASNTDVIHNPHFYEGAFALRLYRRMRDVFAFPDIHVGWIPFAYQRGLRAIKRNKIEVIAAGFPPASSAIVARMLSRKTGLPYLLDLRDGWTDNPYTACPTQLHQRGHAFLEKKVIGGATAVTVYGDPLSEHLIKRYPQLRGRVNVLPNGFDPADLDAIVPRQRSDGRYKIVYMGSLNTYHEENFLTLLAAIKALPEKLHSSLDVMFIGRSYQRAQEQVAEAGLNDRVELKSYLPHSEALSHLASADAALLFVRKGDFDSQTGKLFEYLMIGRPILACIEPQGACAEVLRKAGHSRWITPPDDIERLTQTIANLAEAGWPQPDSAQIEQFSRKRNTERLAAILDQIADNKIQPSLNP